MAFDFILARWIIYPGNAENAIYLCRCLSQKPLTLPYQHAFGVLKLASALSGIGDDMACQTETASFCLFDLTQNKCPDIL